MQKDVLMWSGPAGTKPRECQKGCPIRDSICSFASCRPCLAEMAKVLPRPFQCVFDRLRLHWGWDRLGPPAGRL